MAGDEVSREAVSASLPPGRMPERPKGHASKACEVQASVGSNPTPSATVADFGDEKNPELNRLGVLLFTVKLT